MVKPDKCELTRYPAPVLTKAAKPVVKIDEDVNPEARPVVEGDISFVPQVDEAPEEVVLEKPVHEVAQESDESDEEDGVFDDSHLSEEMVPPELAGSEEPIGEAPAETAPMEDQSGEMEAETAPPEAPAPKMAEDEAKEARIVLEKEMRNNVQSYLELAVGYSNCGFWDEATGILTRYAGYREKDPCA